MKICIISKNFPPKICGVGDYTYWLAKNLIDKFDIYIITEQFQLQKEIKTLSPDKWNFFSIFKTVKKLSPEIVNIQYVPYLYGRAGIALYIAILPIVIKIIIKAKIVITFHEVHIKWSGRDFILGAIQRLQTFLLLFFSDAAIVTNEKRINWLKFYCPHKKIYKIPVGSNIPLIKKKKEINNKIILTTFGVLHPDRDLATVFEAISLINNIEYWIIGKIDKNSDEFWRLTKLAKKLKIENKIKWFINLSIEDIAKHLCNTDIYISPAKEGPSGRRGTLVAALARNLPIIAYDGCEREKIFVNNENIILVNPYDKKMLTNKINLLINNKKVSEKISENAKKTYNNYFSWQIISDEYEKIFNSIAK